MRKKEQKREKKRKENEIYHQAFFTQEKNEIKQNKILLIKTTNLGNHIQKKAFYTPFRLND